MAIKIITGPTAEPITLAVAKLHLKIEADVTVEDTLISAMIVAARRAAEALTGRAMMTQTLELALDDFPRADCRAGYDRDAKNQALQIKLPRPPLVSITSFKYVDTAGVLQTLGLSGYQLDEHSQPARLLPPVDDYWPQTSNQVNSVLIRYAAGYADADAVPQEIKNWMLLRIGMLYENREEFVVGSSIAEIPFVDRMLDDAKVWGI